MNHLSHLFKDGKCLFLAYDQGMEHGPIEFNEDNVNPKSIIQIAKRGKFNALIVQKGIAEKYREDIRKAGVRLIIKLNGKTNLAKGEPLSTQVCTVREAIKLGACAVGYTIYIGSEHEDIMFREFAAIEREAHAHGLPVIAWVYPRGKALAGKDEKMLMAYAARVALELGADIVKLHWSGGVDALHWAVESAGRVKVVIAGGHKEGERALLKQVKEAMETGIVGFAIGRNIWQHKKPVELADKIRNVIWPEEK